MTSRVHALLPLLAAAGCGNYSNDDVEFLNALPHASDLTVKVPQQGTTRQGLGGNPDAGGLATCGDHLGDTSCYFIDTVWQSGQFNAGLYDILGILDYVEQFPPTSRTGNGRVWGPFPDGSHAGFDVEVTIDKTPPDTYAWAFKYRKSGSPPGTAWFSFVSGQFEAIGGARRGTGTFFGDGAGAQSLGMDTTLKGASLDAGYETDKNPIQVDLFLAGGGATLSYDAREYVGDTWQPDGGALRFVIPTWTDAGVLVELSLATNWEVDGTGRGFAEVLSPPSMVGTTYTQCWGPQPTYAISYVEIHADGGMASAGSAGSCIQSF